MTRTWMMTLGLMGSSLFAQQYPQQQYPQQGYPQQQQYPDYQADPNYGGQYPADSQGVYAPAPPPPPQYAYSQPPCPGPGYSWVDGSWGFTGGRYNWVAGSWALPPYAGGYWVAPRYSSGRFFGGFWGGARVYGHADYGYRGHYEAPRPVYRAEHGFARGGERHFEGGHRR